MDIIIHEDDLKQIIKDNLMAKGNNVSNISIIFEAPLAPSALAGLPGSSIMIGQVDQLNQTFQRSDSMRPKLALKCNIDTT